VAAWFNGGALVSAHEVTLHQAQLVLGWVTIITPVNHLDMCPSTQVSSVWPSFAASVNEYQRKLGHAHTA